MLSYIDKYLLKKRWYEVDRKLDYGLNLNDSDKNLMKQKNYAFSSDR